MAATAAAVVPEEDTELRDLLVQTLENSGVLNRIKVERAGPGRGDAGRARGPQGLCGRRASQRVARGRVWAAGGGRLLAEPGRVSGGGPRGGPGCARGVRDGRPARAAAAGRWLAWRRGRDCGAERPGRALGAGRAGSGGFVREGLAVHLTSLHLPARRCCLVSVRLLDGGDGACGTYVVCTSGHENCLETIFVPLPLFFKKRLNSEQLCF